MPTLLSIDLLLFAVCAWLAIGFAGLAAPRNLRYISKILFPLGALVGALVGLVGLGFLGKAAEVAVLAVGLPDLPFHLRLDNLSAVFVLLLGFVSVGISIFAAGYFRKGEGAAPGLMCLQYHAFLASMLFVLLADDAYAFMVAWETMALSSFFLVTTDHRQAEIRRAGFLYLLIAHVGAIAILLCFGLMTGGAGDYSFAGMRAQELSPFWASAAFLLALAGFGAKAGLVPLHVWLPEAHPAAPSPVSAMMSGVMLKTAIYGLLRVSFDLLHTTLWWWGVVALAVGLVTALFGVLYSTVQSDMKRLLAYSSIENIGLIAVGIGLTLIFHAYRMEALAALAMTAMLYHCLAHAAFKSLLFLCTGSVLHATRERSLGKLGGLDPPHALGGLAGSGRRHRQRGIAALVGIRFGMAVAAKLPVLAGLAASLAQHGGPRGGGAGGSGRSAGRLRHGQVLRHHFSWPDARAGAQGGPRCRTVGEVRPGLAGAHHAAIGDPAINGDLARRRRHPADARHRSCRPAQRAGLVDAGADLGRACELRAADLPGHHCHHAAVGALAGAPPLSWPRAAHTAAWDCGYHFQGPRAQDTAEGFSQPIRRIFEPMFRMTRHFPTARDTTPYYSVKVEDHFWHWLYLPLAGLAGRISALIVTLQGGRIAVYLMYSFITLLVLLLVARP